ncbi:hypothetical protein MNBD_GAMMA21-70 [hydrothermal vent metagenome]|uniref:Uncharacterized protein n=1 Tax=hydrothermal vent metagenome TaxID=652676 RepID=A0A3B1AK45_9ZZZZ
MLRSVFTSKFTDKRAMFAFMGEKEEKLIALKDMIEEGKIKLVVDKIYFYQQIIETHQRVETEQRRGIVVLSFGNNNS